ncbi:MAG: hypothetical protein ALECFALPRED_006089 [Alectoria fallacina]|uniref:Uncharacterized protein n=1 Tax=Alectoria fallacina TaxID=1903189 RepID=A0A8H3G212_9LECA|nr:MAG: hypothetical protein ALECFALPRED_006089 [Alectoria fallacina]
MITIDLDGHSQSDQFVFVPWNEIRDMAQHIVDSCVYFLSRGGFITYGVGRTLESLIYPTSYGGDNAEIPYPAWVWEPDGTVEFVAIPSNPATDEYIQGTKVFSEIPGYNDTEQPGEDTRRARE